MNEWSSACNDETLKELPEKSLQNYYVCEEHFGNEDFIYKCTPHKKRLKVGAVPKESSRVKCLKCKYTG